MALSPAIRQSEALYTALISHPEGIWIGKLDSDANMQELRTGDRKINIHIPELEEWLKSVNAESEKKALSPSAEYPFILNAGRHTRNVANTLMRDPSWLKGKRGCTVAVNPEDADRIGIKDGMLVRIVTEAGEAAVEAEITADVRKGQVLHPAWVRSDSRWKSVWCECKPSYEKHSPRSARGNPAAPVCSLQDRTFILKIHQKRIAMTTFEKEPAISTIDQALIILFFGTLWGLCETAGGTAIRSALTVLRAALLTGAGMGIMGCLFGITRKPGHLVLASLVTASAMQLAVPILHCSPLCKANSNLAVLLHATVLSVPLLYADRETAPL
jgi:hypothetical protein